MPTREEVVNLTGVNVGEADIARAQALIELVAGRTVEEVGTRDAKWLNLAMVYQAAWMDSHPEVFSSMDVASISQLDLSISFRDESEAQYLSPLARRALRRCSWKGTRSIPVNSHFLRYTYDDYSWSPM